MTTCTEILRWILAGRQDIPQDVADLAHLICAAMDAGVLRYEDVKPLLHGPRGGLDGRLLALAADLYLAEQVQP